MLITLKSEKLNKLNNVKEHCIYIYMSLFNFNIIYNRKYLCGAAGYDEIVPIFT